DAFASWVVSLSYSPTMILIMILLAYVILGMFMDAIGMMLLTLPVVYPAVIALGFDPIWFGIILVKMVEMCLITPPIGLNCYVVNGMRPDIPLQDIFRGIWPFFAIDIVVVGLLIAYPEIVTFLPEMMLKN
ncbi:MAG TPA: C4-dicarboxylate ABC transporter permease, partial [Gammaproteobacteria bacterium]|nr:C4-dicarboxylate ABC transporter permease [Gammaproteobacteria bacterium]